MRICLRHEAGIRFPGKDISMDEYGEFIEKFADELKKFTTPDEQVSTKVVKKNNGVYQQAIVIRTKDSNAFPLIYPTQQFLEYQDTKDIETIARQTIRFYRDQNRRLHGHLQPRRLRKFSVPWKPYLHI